MRWLQFLKTEKGIADVYVGALTIPPEWYRVAGIHLEKTGSVGAVWLAHDRETDVIHVYETAIFHKEIPLVIADGLNSRGMWIPIAWPREAKDLSRVLADDQKCNMLPDDVVDTPAMTEVLASQVSERLRTQRLKADKRLMQWITEFERFWKQEGSVPADGFPLMSATRHAVAQLDYAKRQHAGKKRVGNYPRVAII